MQNLTSIGFDRLLSEIQKRQVFEYALCFFRKSTRDKILNPKVLVINYSKMSRFGFSSLLLTRFSDFKITFPAFIRSVCPNPIKKEQVRMQISTSFCRLNDCSDGSIFKPQRGNSFLGLSLFQVIKTINPNQR